MSAKKVVIHLDFHEYDTAETLDHLQELVATGKVAGMIFAVAMKRGEEPVFGATGRLARNSIEAAGYASVLADRFTEPYLVCSSGK